jgi:uncharacterized protein YmfQ (DUF2313 family)
VTLIATRGTASDTEAKTNYIHTLPIPVSITSQPELLLPVNIGETVTFHITATGTEPLSYQWYVNSGIIGGANASSYTIPAATAPMDGNVYQCVVSNIVGPVTSNNGVLNVIVLPVITAEPEDTTIHDGDLAIYQVTVTSPTYATYQWFFDGAPVGTNSNTYTRTTVLGDTNKRVWCQIVNDDGMTESYHALLTVIPEIVIVTQPRLQIVFDGATSTFSVTATGTGLSYQWFADNILIPGATSSTYSHTAISAENDTIYKCVVSDAISQVESDEVPLMVMIVGATACGLGYGTSRYAINKYKVCYGAEATKLHYYALKKLFPMPQMEGVLNDDLDIEGFYLDNAYYAGGGRSPADTDNYPKGLHAEFFSDTTMSLVNDWLRVYGLTVTGSVADKRLAIAAAQNAKGGVSKAYYTAVALALGYTITITEGTSLLFLIGVTQLPHALYEPSVQWTWNISTTSLSATQDAYLEELFTRLAPAHTVVSFTYI